MKRIVRTIASAGTGLALAAGSVATAVPAHAVGEGCYGFPSIPDAYVCVTQVNPGNAAPDTGTSTMYVGTIPSFCYGSGCTGDQPVYVPVPTVDPEDAPILVFVYKSQTYSFGTGGLGGGTGIVDPYVELARELAQFVVDMVGTIDCSGLEEFLSEALGRSVNIRQC